MSISKSAALRALLKRPGPVLAVGAHSPLSARIVERTGFDLVWASSFEISAAHGVPDASILSMAEQLESARRMNDAISIPVLADCDSGFGNAINVMRAVQEYEQAGIAGICIEDNVFPKRCSFYSGVKRELASIEEHAGKIRAAKAAQRSSQFLVFARTEALIAGWGLKEALRRARAYVAAGADGIVIHSKATNPNEVKAFAKAWKSRCPLVAIPTTYNRISAKELGRSGFKVVIFANHALRSSLKAMQSTLQTLRRTQRASSVNHAVASLEDVYAMIGVSDLKGNEAQFLPRDGNQVKAIILSAGFDEQLLPLTQDRPKSMLDIAGKSLLERQIETLSRCGIRDVIVVRGYKKEAIQLPNIRCYDNDDFAKGYILSSLFRVKHELEGRCLLLYGDILFDQTIVEKLLKSSGDLSLVVDRAWKDQRPETRPQAFPPELVITDSVPRNGYRFLPSTRPARVRQIGRTLDPARANGEFIGMALLSSRGAKAVREIYEQVSRTHRRKRFHEAKSVKVAGLTDLFQEAVNRRCKVQAVDIYKGWMEIDTLEDYQRVWKAMAK